MPFHVKTGGVWQASYPKVKVAGVWEDVAKAYVKTGGVWQQVFGGINGSYPGFPGATYDHETYSLSSFPTYANIEFRSNGEVEINSSATSSTTSTYAFDWLVAGTAADIWIQRTVIGSLDTDAGSGRLNMASNRIFGVTSSVEDTEDQKFVTFRFYDAASGGNELGVISTNLQAGNGIV